MLSFFPVGRRVFPVINTNGNRWTGRGERRCSRRSTEPGLPRNTPVSIKRCADFLLVLGDSSMQARTPCCFAQHSTAQHNTARKQKGVCHGCWTTGEARKTMALSSRGLHFHALLNLRRWWRRNSTCDALASCAHAHVNATLRTRQAWERSVASAASSIWSDVQHQDETFHTTFVDVGSNDGGLSSSSL